MADYIQAKDEYTEKDLYTKRGLSFQQFIHLDGVLWPKDTERYPILAVESTRPFSFTEGQMGLFLNAKLDNQVIYTNTLCGRLKCRLQIGNWVYGHRYEEGENIVTANEENEWWPEAFSQGIFFTCSMNDLSRTGEEVNVSNNVQPVQKHPINIYNEGVKGYVIDIPSSMDGKLSGFVKFEIMHYLRMPEYSRPANMYNCTAPIYDFHFEYRRAEVPLEDEKNIYKKEINLDNEESYEITNKIGTIGAKNPHSDGAVYDKGENSGYLEHVIDNHGSELTVEEHTLWRYYDQLKQPRSIVTITVRRNLNRNYSPMYVYTFQGKNYRIVSKADNWVDQTVKLTLVEINQ